MIYRRLSQSLLYVLSVQLLALALMMLIRVSFAVINFPDNYAFDAALMCRALLKGVPFDAQVASYVALLPLALLLVMSFLRRVNISGAIRAAAWYYGIVYALVLPTQVADIHYFQFFGNHLSWNAVEWFKFGGTTLGMLFGEASNYAYIVCGLLVAMVFCVSIHYIRIGLEKHFERERSGVGINTDKVRDVALSSSLTLLSCVVCFLGLRASLERYPLSVSFATFCDKTFYNRIPVNPWINIIETLKQSGKRYQADILRSVDEAEALSYVRETLGIHGDDTEHPLDRFVEADTLLAVRRPNVVVILLESMSAQILQLEYEGKPLTPYFRALRDSSIYFSNMYSAGIHTNNGILATLYGYSPNFAQTTMGTPSDLYTGLPMTLRQNGYNTYAFVTSNPNYDNMQSFFYDNGIERLYSLYDYPSDEQVNNFGVPDDVLFRHGLEVFNERDVSKPFFALLLTVSNHQPYVYPDSFALRGADDGERTVAYVDDSVREFIAQACQTEWGKNTIFVLCGDHGGPLGYKPYDMTLQFNHVMAYITGEPVKNFYRHYDGVAGQIDLFPTVMGLTGLPYVNNTLGVDLLKQGRKYVHFVSDTHLGCTDGEWLWCHNVGDGTDFLYRVASEEERDGLTNVAADNVIDDYSAVADSMKRYAVSMMKINNTAVSKRWTR